MAFVNEENKRKIDTIVHNVEDFAVLVDEPQKNGRVDGLSCQPGLNMHTEAEGFRSLSKDIKKGIFKTLVMGKFKNGKSTFINALVGRVMMAAKATACTAVIATVEFGENTQQVKIVYKDSENTKVMSIDQFTKEFALSEADQDLIMEGQKFDKFANVSHVEMQSMDEMFADGMRLIDSPGLEEDFARTTTTNEYVPKVNAIIFTMCATSLFSAKEKEYIAENFVGKNPRNVFFVVNRIDNLTPGQLEESVIPSVKQGLREVFTDEKGVFNEKLYESRVFFTNAYGALCVRINEPFKVIYGKKEQVIDISIEDTGMPEFEAALSDFLNSDERIYATFSSTLTGMANTYQSAEKNILAVKAVRQQSKEQRKENAEKAQKELSLAKEQVEELRKTVKSSGVNISQIVYNNLINFVQTDIPREFAAYAKSKENQERFGMGSVLKLAGSMLISKLPIESLKKRFGNQEEILRPLIKRVNAYIKEQLEAWSKRVPTMISRDISDLQKELDAQTADFDVTLDQAVNLFAYGNAKAPQSQGGGIKAGLQTLLALSNWDVSLAVEGQAKGGMAWVEFAKRAAVQIALDMAVGMVFGGVFLIPALIIELISLKYRAGQTAEQLLTGIGNKAFEVLAEKIRDNELTFKEGIIGEFTVKGENVASTALNMVKDAENNMARLLNENDKDQKAADAENSRNEQNLMAMHERIDSVYTMLFGHKPSESEFSNLARKKKQE